MISAHGRREKTMGLIDADKFLQNMTDLYRQAGWNEREVHFSLVDLQMNIFMEDTIPIPVIRCKDCKYSSPNQVYGCRINSFAGDLDERMYSDDFCSMAERKEEIEKMNEKDISRLAGEIADMAINGASDEELKEAIDNSKDIIDGHKDNVDFLKNAENGINRLYECFVPWNNGDISEDEPTIHVSLNEMRKVVLKMLGTTHIPDVYNGDLVGYTVYEKPWKKLMHEFGIEYYDVDDLIEAIGEKANEEEKSFEEAADELIKKCF